MNAPVHPSAIPYRVPRPGQAFPPLGSAIRILHLLLTALGTLCFFGVVVGWTVAIIADPDHPDDTVMGVSGLMLLVAILVLYAQVFAGMAWLYKAWSWLPPQERYAKSWRGAISPAQAALMLLVPYFHYYWMFVVNTGLCDALDRLRVSYPTRQVAPKSLAIAACICQLVVPVPVGGILWALFMLRIERLTREMSEAAGPRSAPLF